MQGKAEQPPRNVATGRDLARSVTTSRKSLKTGDLGFEPRLTDPESVVLPLHQSPNSPQSYRPGSCRQAGRVEARDSGSTVDFAGVPPLIHSGKGATAP